METEQGRKYHTRAPPTFIFAIKQKLGLVGTIILYVTLRFITNNQGSLPYHATKKAFARVRLCTTQVGCGRRRALAMTVCGWGRTL